MSPGNWNGMIGEVLDGRADFAIADISITSKRASAVRFTMPWMNLGISILYVQPRPAPPSMLAFLDPFTTDVSFYKQGFRNDEVDIFVLNCVEKEF